MELAGAFTVLANDPSDIHFSAAGLTKLLATMPYGSVTCIKQITLLINSKSRLNRLIL